jgi:phosphonate metabolism protein (transferase hexapeptide repeat family)
VHATAQVRESTLGRFTEIKERVSFAESVLGDYSYVERDAQVIYARIGKFTAIAAASCIHALEHPMHRISQHKITYRPNEYFLGAKLDKDFRSHRQGRAVRIGHDVWVGHGAVIMPGVTIGHGAVIGAGSVVTKSVDPYAIVAGAPAKFLRWRFEPAMAARMAALAWWDWEHDRLAATVEDMRSLAPEDFLRKHETR